MCADIQQAIIDVLIKKTINAGRKYKAKTILLGGGVAANKELNKQMKEKAKEFSFHALNPKFCTDNAAMIAAAGYFRRKEKINWKKLSAESNLRIR